MNNQQELQNQAEQNLETRRQAMLLHYESTEFEDVSDADLRSLKELIRNDLCHGIVFLPGEGVHEDASEVNVVNVPDSVIVDGGRTNSAESDCGSSLVSTSSRNKKSRVTYRTGPVFGNSHERPDLTKTKGYAFELLKLANMHEKSDKRKVIWWKSRAAEIKQELRIIRNNKSTKIRSHCIRLLKQEKFTAENLPNSVQSRSLFGGRYDTEHERLGYGIEQVKRREDLQDEESRENAISEVREEHAERLNDLRTRFIDLLKDADCKTKNDLDPVQVWCPRMALDENSSIQDSDEHEKRFETFVSNFLSFMVNRKEWRSKYLNVRISVITTVVDEAYACLVLENLLPELIGIVKKETEKKGTKYTSKRRRKETWMRKDSNGIRYRGGMATDQTHGWSMRGIKRFNLLVKKIYELRRDEANVRILDEHCTRVYINSDLRGDEDWADCDAHDTDNSTLSSMVAENGFDLFDA